MKSVSPLSASILLALVALPLQAAEPAAAAAPVSGAAAVVQMLGALGLVLAVLLGAMWLLRRLSGSKLAGPAPIRTVGGIAVGSRERVLLLEVGEHWLVVGVAPGSVTGIATLPRGELPEGPQASAPDFASVLARLKGGRP
ncbi:flagellar biosynthetic protein FliO [Methyloversatilis universalis]|uniref:flagellar biosynthetic protein FliO n=1 Tax=Methyloversatilis universalis TaxID=378211 RepID=UPI000370A359|nr:flagellar biosynthetic protein FliO [Methyloversatilis universalis]